MMMTWSVYFLEYHDDDEAVNRRRFNLIRLLRDSHLSNGRDPGPWRRARGKHGVPPLRNQLLYQGGVEVLVLVLDALLVL